MSKKMLIDASHPEETRVVVVDGTRVEELDFESQNKRQLRGNVYLARVTRVEPSLQAAFVEYGGNRQGFLAFSEIHPDYYQIPYEDRMALLEAEEAENLAAEAEEEEEAEAKAKASSNAPEDEGEDTDAEDENADDDNADDASDETDDEDNGDETDIEDDSDDDKEVAQEQAKTATNRRRRMSRRRYKIQEVIKRGQILLIQAVKEERGNKGAAMTTYLSLAGRYCVLMPNTPRGGGISRKISNGSDRKRLKTIMSELSVPQGMGVIVRTAGAKRTKVEIKRDYDYLSRLWETIRETTLKSIAPALIHEEGNLVKRSIRDLYDKDIGEILVAGDEAYKTAKSFIKMLMPSHTKNVKSYKDTIPLFVRYGVEKQIEASLSSTVQLKSGGYLVIHPTEALVSIDVNSGRSTRERNVERTALKTNLEAADEMARQMRLRDLAGLVVIDFIDMDENRNNRAVEKRMKEALSQDRARVQMSRISQFGLMEISRQRRRRSLLEGSSASCEHCDGVGRKRTVESSALAAIRAIEEIGVRRQSRRTRLTVAPDVALYLFNEKRALLQSIDSEFDMFTELVGDDTLIRPAFGIESLQSREDKEADPLTAIEEEHRKAAKSSDKGGKKKRGRKSDDEAEAQNETSPKSEDDTQEDGEGRKRRRRRGKRGGRGRKGQDTPGADAEASEDATASENADTANDSSDDVDAASADTPSTEKPRSAARRKAPARKSKSTEMSEGETKDTASDSVTGSASSDDISAPEDSTVRKSTARRKAPARKSAKTDAEPVENADSLESADKEDAKPEEKAKRTRKAPARKKASAKESPTDDAKSETAEEASKPKRRRAAPKKVEKAAETKAEKAPAKTAAKKPAAKKTAPKKSPKAKADDKGEAPEATKEPAKATSSTRRKAPTRKATSETDAAPAKPAKKKGLLGRLLKD